LGVPEMIGRPAYQQVADDLRSQIATGRLPVGEAIPSTAQLIQRYRVSSTVVRQAVARLRGEGLVVGQPGKAVYVRATPNEIERESLQLEDLAQRVDGVRTELDALAEQVDSKLNPADLDEIRHEIKQLRRAFSVLQTHVIDLYSRMGQPYPREAVMTAQGETPPRRRKASTSRPAEA
jgi:DNA-binding GntR family transcriptional regulator